MSPTSGTRNTLKKKHPAEDFYRAHKDEMASLSEQELQLISALCIAQAGSPAPDGTQGQPMNKYLEAAKKILKENPKLNRAEALEVVRLRNNKEVKEKGYDPLYPPDLETG